MSVYRDFNQAALDKEYSPSQWVTRTTPEKAIQQHIDCLERGTESSKLSVPAVELGVRYANDQVCTVDIYSPQCVTATSPVVVYVHGGYWCAGVLEHSGGWFAHSVVDRGASLVTVEYGLCGNVNMYTAVRHVRTALAFLGQRFQSRPITVVGHSAGGHLCAMLLSTNWSDFGLKSNPIRNAVLVSGIYDLEPIRLSCVDGESNLKLRDEPSQARRNSPMHLVKDAASQKTSVFVVVAERDSTEFRRQSKEYAKKLTDAGGSVEYIEVPVHDHFSIIETLTDEGEVLTQRLLGAVFAEGLPPKRKRTSPAGFGWASVGLAFLGGALAGTVVGNMAGGGAADGLDLSAFTSLLPGVDASA
mmetsp:Transcript_22691/g.25218  ORF Transcript_22691/g.25218 Transcript_22691/m.25218 type:complete len:359 (-) Transcript_22691:41-1117(-)|eukprot:CAMPEP_0205828134 /NCGR_PEP_ID=MMETSP0206-20130828/34180_1 /ASSEMBLY_ACC=CAM_ASM_000279 /TAXON_ID=36767 /ORGANISM="Euplotes focardii, Strain TN1" /LENGTH=358 /DNA_ID=CAMNT_0053129659 /DNA_START=22 /DNA_END=1098 /DNA_ORIENTATION=+